jgi:hypothetical protein
MAESYITRKSGGGGGPQTELPIITFISKTDTSLTFTIRNEDDEQAIVYYELEDNTPDSSSIILSGSTTSSNVVFSGLTPDTSYTLYVWANAFNKSVSQVAESTQTTTRVTVAPTITFISKTFNSITFNITNNDSETSTIYYQQNVTPPTTNSVVVNAGQTSSNLTISGLTKQTSYTVYAQAQANNRLLSSVVSFTETTPDFPTLTNPTITFVSATANSISFTLTNNASVSANIYYEHSDTTPDANFVTLGAGVTSSTLTISGLNASTSYTIYAQAQQTNNNPSGVVSTTQSTPAPVPTYSGSPLNFFPSTFANYGLEFNTTTEQIRVTTFLGVSRRITATGGRSIFQGVTYDRTFDPPITFIVPGSGAWVTAIGQWTGTPQYITCTYVGPE